jgi:predicted dehydrogenase
MHFSAPAAIDGVATRPLRAGVAGAGFIGAVHARSARLAGATLAGVATSSPERSREAAERLGAAQAYATPEELATADDVDVLHICTPNHLHARLARLALEHGKHVICEKPLAVGSDEANGLIDAARSAARVATVPFVYRFHPVVREARARVRDGSLGPVRLIHGGYLQDWLASADDDNWRIDADLGGPSRAFADIGSHWCDLVEFITGYRIEAICAQTSTVHAERVTRGTARAFEAASDNGGTRRAVTTEDAVTALFRTAGGVHGTLIISQVSPGRKNHLHVEIACAEATCSSPTATLPSPAKHPMAFRRSPTARGALISSMRCSLLRRRAAGWRSDGAVARDARYPEELPRRRGAPRGRAGLQRGRDPCRRGGERRRQVDAHEGPGRRAPT